MKIELTKDEWETLNLLLTIAEISTKSDWAKGMAVKYRKLQDVRKKLGEEWKDEDEIS